jgi:hypothetical protein
MRRSNAGWPDHTAWLFVSSIFWLFITVCFCPFCQNGRLQAPVVENRSQILSARRFLHLPQITLWKVHDFLNNNSLSSKFRLWVLRLRSFGWDAAMFWSYIDYHSFGGHCCLSLHSSTLKVVAGGSSETLVRTYTSTRRSKLVVKFTTTKHDLMLISLCSHFRGQCNVISRWWSMGPRSWIWLGQTKYVMLYFLSGKGRCSYSFSKQQFLIIMHRFDKTFCFSCHTIRTVLVSFALLFKTSNHIATIPCRLSAYAGCTKLHRVIFQNTAIFTRYPRISLLATHRSTVSHWRVCL